MSKHHCTFDSAYGFVPGRFPMALMCDCGRWGMPAFGEWQVVPKELLPSACTHLTTKRRIEARYGFGVAIAVVVVLLFLSFA
jgi:hypothetical protein